MKYKIGTGVSCLSMLLYAISFSFFSSCSEHEKEDDFRRGTSLLSIPVSAGNADTSEGDPVLSYSLYIYEEDKAQSSGFSYYDKRENLLKADLDTVVFKFSNQALAQKAYRILFIATPNSQPEIQIENRTSLTRWDDIRIDQLAEKLSKHNFHAIFNVEGKDILEGKLTRIDVSLKRIVGQLVYQIYRINTVGGQDPIAVDANVLSVLDRVYKIKATYTGTTKQLTADLKSIEITEQEQTFDTSLDDDFKLSIPQPNIGLQAYLKEGKIVSGAVKMEGLYLFPSDGLQVEVELTFYYYDTTPTCNELTHQHTKECFQEKTMSLHLPKSGKLQLNANTYTINNIMIKHNRIIDATANMGIDLETGWN